MIMIAIMGGTTLARKLRPSFSSSSSPTGSDGSVEFAEFGVLPDAAVEGVAVGVGCGAEDCTGGEGVDSWERVGRERERMRITRKMGRGILG